MRKILKKVMRWSLIGTALALTPAVAQTISHARGLKKKEKAAREKELIHGQKFPDLPEKAEGSRSMAEITEKLREVPFNPKPYGGMTSTLMFAMADTIPMMLECRKSTCGMLYSYPEPFHKVIITSEDGTPISGMVAIHDDGRSRPALLMVHGLFGSKNIWFSQQVVLSAYYGWGYNVMAIDLRFFGESKIYSDAPGTGGWKEGQDIIAAVKFLKGHEEVTSVAVMGGSYGGASAMCAAYQSEPKGLIDGGIISWGGYGYTPDQVKYISTVPKPWEPFFPVYLYFMGCFSLTLGSKIKEFPQFEDFLGKYSAVYYGVEPEEMHNRSSAALHFDEIQTPLLVINAEDDPVIPFDQAVMMAEKASDNPWIDVWHMHKGGHCGFVTVDKQWMSEICRGFFNYWATPGKPLT